VQRLQSQLVSLRRGVEAFESKVTTVRAEADSAAYSDAQGVHGMT